MLKETSIVSVNISNKIAATPKPRLNDQTFFSILSHMNVIHVLKLVEFCSIMQNTMFEFD